MIIQCRVIFSDDRINLSFSGSGFVVQVNLIESNLAPLYEAVDHSDSNDNDAFYSDRRVLEQFCPYPVPEKYLLSSILHKVSL